MQYNTMYFYIKSIIAFINLVTFWYLYVVNPNVSCIIQVDTFEFEAVDLGDLDSVIVNHDGRGHGAGIFLDKIVVKERDSENSELQFVFPCGRWLDSHQDDCLTQRTLRMLGKGFTFCLPVC